MKKNNIDPFFILQNRKEAESEVIFKIKEDLYWEFFSETRGAY